MNSTSRSGFDPHHQRLMQKRSQLSKLTRDQFETYVSSKEKFVEISKRLGVDQNLIKKDKEIKKRDESSPDAPKDTNESQQHTNAMYLKTGRLNKASVRSHILKRYKKVITDKIMARVDDYLKDRNTFDFMVYLQMLWSILIEK